MDGRIFHFLNTVFSILVENTMVFFEMILRTCFVLMVQNQLLLLKQKLRIWGLGLQKASKLWTTKIKSRRLWITSNKRPVRICTGKKNVKISVIKKIREKAISAWGCSVVLERNWQIRRLAKENVLQII